MSLGFAIDALYDSGWTMAEPKGIARFADGRPYPSQEHIEQVFLENGFSLSVRHIQLFDCHRAEWRDGAGQACGAVVGQTAEEAAVYALSQLRRQMTQRASAATSAAR
ncbi:MAG: hypothetical protein SFY69_09995 [Planctomycetota bacterium]|nr:hypothetical protein [Planctomycetota bacterium]